MANRLSEATSPYLLQHQDNPVDWQEWGADAFAEARLRDVPILLSVGYSACHWCHVMAHESFEDDQVAQVLNAGYVAVKVDREERPDVDAVYMAATTALTGHGGWPMTAILTADGEPFFCGTYFPREQFLQLLGAISEAWAERRDDVLASSAHIASALRTASGPAGGELDVSALDVSAVALGRGFDRLRGGFGGAPKFPPSMVLEFLLRHHDRTGDPSALEMVQRSCEAMARGGIYDQLAGGFARYAVDADWVVPHFEKMLYDNAQLARVYLHWWKASGSSLAERVARETADFLVHDLATDEGGFACALDADTDGVEGLTYAWTPAELRDVLGAEDGSRAAELLVVTAAGTFEQGSSTLQLPRDDPDAEWWGRTRVRLRVARDRRPQPHRDDKVVTSWNGLAIAALADLGAVLQEPSYLVTATRAARFLVAKHVVDGRLRRSSRHGRVGSAAGVADDYGNLCEGLLTLHQATGDPHWLEVTGRLLDVALAHFGADDGGFHDTADDAEQLVTRPRGIGDNAEPSGQSALAGALLTYGALTGSPRHLEAAGAAVDAAGSVASRDPRFAGWALAVAEARAAGPLQVAVVGQGHLADALVHEVWSSRSPGIVVTAGAPDAPGLPLLAGRPIVDGDAAAYVCRGFVCDRPVTTVEALHAALAPSASR